MYTDIPKEYGGSGYSFLEHYIITEALNYECTAIAQMISISHLSMAAILLGGTEEQKKKFIGTMTKGYRTGCFCLTESDAGSDSSIMQTVAEKKGDRYTLNGSKRFISNGKYADLLCVFATIDRSLGTKGISCFAVPRTTPGIEVVSVEEKMGQRALSVAELKFENVELS
ncbi:unnamed protein product, partial [marine sediment metagenome]